MNMIMRLAGKGLSTTKVLSEATNEMFKKKTIQKFEGFHLAILDMFAVLNEALPGKHWVVPSSDEIEKCFFKVQEAPANKKELVVNFMKNNIQLSKADNTLLFIGLATPPAAMAAKKAGEAVPPFKFIKHVPDVLFVPAATLISLVSVKIARSLLAHRRI